MNIETINKNKNNSGIYKAKMQTIIYNLDTKNNTCADCGKQKSMDFASINNGILICSDCAKEHQSLGYNISFIHSLGDKWDDYLFNYIKVGGNSRFIQFCKDYKLDKENINIIQKYKSKGLAYYREILRSEVLGYDPPENINVNKAYEEEKEIPDNYPEFKKYSFVKHVDMNYLEKKFYTKKEEKEDEGIFGKIGGFFGNVKKNIDNLGIGEWDIVKKVKDFNISEVKQKGVDMFEHFIFGEKKEEDNKDEELEEENDNNIINEINKEKNINDNNNDKRKNEFNKIFGVEAKKDNKENIIIKNSDINKTEKEKEESKKENIIENEGKIEIKEEIKILTDETNNIIINNSGNKNCDTNEKNSIDDKKNNQQLKDEQLDSDIKINDKEEAKEKNGNETAIEEILKENNFENDNTKMNNEEKDELEKMLQE